MYIIQMKNLYLREYKKIADKYKIISISTIIILKNGKQQGSLYDVKSVGDINNIIEKYV